MTAPTPEQFLAAPPDPDEEDHPASFGPGGCDLTARPGYVWQLPPNALESIAESLRQLVAIRSGPANIPAAEHLEVAEERDLLRERCADVDSRYKAAVAVIDQISALVKPSTSKLANSVREVIAGRAAPQVPEPEPEVVHAAPTGGKSPCGVHYMEGTFGADPTCPECLAAEQAPQQPKPDAPVEEWRAYARSVRNMRGGESSIDTMNRSQIRTMLGIEQPVSGEGTGA